ncbi:hypothetical protein BFC17_17375 [Alteromonas lipolytica]|uniref:Uncharacterized protein n=1 Tax=Alteromonas lipolytica TaxID=1856405 RepID=A0A1E8FH82_9ALTE|nr:hypothetical protein BFC17_17375 [Alteromonas lipolytica]
MLYSVAALSVLLVFCFVRFLSLAEAQTLQYVTEQEALLLLTQLDIFHLLALPDFWLISLNFTDMAWDMFWLVYSAMSLAIFCVGLIIFHRNVQALTRDQVFTLFLCAGWAHLLLAKSILWFDIPLRLTGPVIALGMLSVLYFSIVAVVVDTTFVIRRKIR